MFLRLLLPTAESINCFASTRFPGITVHRLPPISPSSVQSLLDQARHCLLSRDYPRALAVYESLVHSRQNDSVLWFEYGNAASGARKYDLADRAWTKARKLGAHREDILTLIGHQYIGLRQPDKAQACLRQAASADPKAINPRISLAVLLEKQHRLAESRAAVQQCLAIDSKDEQARYFLAVLDRREGSIEVAESQLRDLIAAGPRHPYVQYACRYELAQLLDRAGAVDEAMRLLEEAKGIVRGLTDTTILISAYERDISSMRGLIQSLPVNILSVWEGLFPTPLRSMVPPIAFLGGHPRSGTTLLEQVLDAHPDVAAFDEPTAFAELVHPAFAQPGELPTHRLNGARDAYLQALIRELGAPVGTRTLVDKNPSLTLRLPLWLRAFPEVRIIMALRDPRDVILSCYFQNLALNGMNVNFLSLDRLVSHYIDLMDVWLAVRQWHGLRAIEVRYEDTVRSLETEGRRATEFLGLTWHESQARYYERSRSKHLYSPTYQDVTQPVYNRSLCRWPAYEKYLAPILPRLEPYCRAFGYT